YRVLFSVATIVRPCTTSGEAYTDPSSGIRLTTCSPPWKAGRYRSKPLRPTLPWYAYHSPEAIAGLCAPRPEAAAAGAATRVAAVSSRTAARGRRRIARLCNVLPRCAGCLIQQVSDDNRLVTSRTDTDHRDRRVDHSFER